MGPAFHHFLVAWILLACVTTGAGLSAAEPWLTDLPAAQARARTEDKAVLVHFSGSDWCGWCMKLRKEVFGKPEFAAYARSNLVLVAVDFPKHSPVEPAVQSANQRLVEQFRVQGFPTLILLDSQGQRLGNVNYAQGGTKTFLTELERLRQISREAVSAKSDLAGKRAGDKASVPLAELTLRRITGSKHRRQALINDRTFAAGETATVELAQGRIQVQCLEIRGNSVVISVNGRKERRELRLTRGT